VSDAGPGGAPLRIAFLSNSNSLHLKEWAEYFAGPLGHRVTVLTIPAPAEPYRNGVELVHLGSRFTGNKLAWLALLPRLRRELMARRPDLFVGYRVVSYGFLASLAGYRPLVLAAQGGDMVWPPDDRLGLFCVRHACRRGDLFNAWSANIRDEMIRHGADPAKIMVCSRGIELSLFPPPPAKPPGPPVIAMTRSLLPSYNTIQFVEAMAVVAKARPDAIAEIAGDGPERPRLEARARELGLLGSSVRFVGRLSREAIVALVGRARIYCSTTITDGLPLSHFEAMAAGCFPVVTDIGANRAWFRNGENALLAPVGDPAALGVALLRALSDEALVAPAVTANRALIEREFDREANMRRIEAAWRELASAYRSGAGSRRPAAGR
jgi:glycosyltransferase involved in cell wall biosynthesis